MNGMAAASFLAAYPGVYGPLKDSVLIFPFVEPGDEVFLKTIIPSRKATKTYLSGKK